MDGSVGKRGVTNPIFSKKMRKLWVSQSCTWNEQNVYYGLKIIKIIGFLLSSIAKINGF